MSEILDMPVDDVLALLEAAVARGHKGAEQELRRQLEEWRETGEVCVFSRLAAGRYLY